MTNHHYHQFTRLAGSAALVALTTVGGASAQSGAYLPDDGLVVVEMETLAEGAGWSGDTSLEGFAGKGYVAWSGPDMSKKPGNGLVGFDTQISEGGAYELRLRNRHDHPDVTDANDVWVRIDGGDWTKVFSSFRGEWTWDTRHRTADGKVGPVVLDLEPGVHKIEFSGRSEGFMIDRVHLFQQGTSNALSIKHVPSIRASVEEPSKEEEKGQEAKATDRTKGKREATAEDAVPAFSEELAVEEPGDKGRAEVEAEASSDAEVPSEAKPRNQLNASQPMVSRLPVIDRIPADRARVRAKDAGRRGGAEGKRPSVRVNEALDSYGEAALGRGLSRFDISLGLEGTSTGAATSESQGTFVAKNYLGNTVDQNKGLRIRALRMNRQPRQLENRIGDIIHWPGGDHCVEDILCVVEQGYNQWASNLHRGPSPLQLLQRSLTWRNISVRPDPVSGASQLKWGTREFNVPDRYFIDCDFTEITQEHGLYVSNSADTSIEGCTFLRVGSQGAQFAHRYLPYQQYDGDCMPYQEPPTHVVRDSHFIDCAYRGTRPSFNLTYFSPGTSENPGSILIEDSSFVCKWPTERHDGHYSTGGLVICRGAGTDPLRPNVGQMMSNVTIRNTLFDFTDGDRAIACIRSVEELVIEESCFIARDHEIPWVQVDRDFSGSDLGGTKTQRIVLRDNVADGVGLKLRLDSSTGSQGSVHIDLHCPGEEVIYDGVTGEEVSRRTL